MTRWVPVLVLDAVACALMSLLLLAATPGVAHAYVDPSVMTYAIQAVAGAAVALSAVVGVAFRRTRRWLFGRLGINPDQKRERDPLWVALDEPDNDALRKDAAAVRAVAGPGDPVRPSGARGAEGAAGQPPAGLPWPKRLALAFLVSFMTVGTLLVAAPLEVVSGSSDFAFLPSQVAPVVVAEALVISLACALALSALRGRAFLYALAAVFAVGVGFYVQALALNRNLPVADGSDVNWSKHVRVIAVSTAVWLAILAAAVALVRFARDRSMLVVGALSAALIVVQGVGTGSLVATDGAGTLVDGSPAARSAVVTEEGLFDVGRENNVIVFVLDTYDTADFKAAIKSDPSLTDSLTGFTWYDNVCGAMIPTRYGVPFLLTGERPTEDDTWKTFLKERYARSPFLTDLAEKGYSTGLYTDHLMLTRTTPEIAKSKVSDLAFNLSDEPVAEMDVAGTVRSLGTVALYRDLPWVLKPLFWFDTDTVVSQMVKPDGGDLAKSEYMRDDAGYYVRMQERGLEVVDRQAAGTFRFIHMTGTHTPHVMSADGVVVGKADATRTTQAVGSLRIAQYYLSELKRLGLYDDATIIFTADHGKWYLTQKFLKKPSSPFILYKPAQTSEEAALPMQVSHAPVMHDDVVPTVIDAIGGDAGKYAGRPLASYTGEEDPNAERLYLTTFSDGKQDTDIVEYAIRGDVMDLGNWSFSGRSWNAQE